MKVLITGSSGMLGSDLTEEFSDSNLYHFSKEQLDITKKSHIIKNFKKIKPGIVINSAAYTDVDGSERNRKEALRVNALAIRNIAMMCRKIDAVLVHYSTDYVFDGNNKNGYRENDKKNPINYYGYTKSLGEDYISRILRKYFIIRSSWLFGRKGKNFVESILSKANENEIKVVNDQFGSPTYTKDLARATKELLVQEYGFGVYHLTNSGYCSWYEFAKEILKNANSKAKVVPISSMQLNRPAKRPKCSILISTKFKNRLPLWSVGLKRYLGEK